MSKKVVFTFGRCNPFTKGHEELIRFVVDLAKRNGSEHRIYLSKSQDPKKNPLPYKQKVGFARLLFPWANIVDDAVAVSTFAICRKLSDTGYTDVTFVVGDDRVVESETNIRKYIMLKDNPKFDKTKHYNFKNFRVVSSGRRTSGISGTTMRSYVTDRNWEGFKAACPTTNAALAKRIYNAVGNFMGVNVKLEEAARPQEKKRLASPDSWLGHFEAGSINQHSSIRGVKKKKFKIIPKSQAAEPARVKKPKLTYDKWSKVVGDNRWDQIKVNKNISREKFKTYIKDHWAGAARFLWNAGNYYFWDALEGNHFEVCDKLGFLKDDKWKDEPWSAPEHIRNTKERIAGSIFGATLSTENDFDKALDQSFDGGPRNKNIDTLHVIHDQFDENDIKWICDRLKKDKKFINITKDFTVVGVHDHGRVVGTPVRKRRKKTPGQLTFNQLRDRVRRDMDSNLAEANNRAANRADIDRMRKLPSYVRINPSPESFNEIIKASIDDVSDRANHGAVRVIKLKGKWYAWPGMACTHHDVIAKVCSASEIYTDEYRNTDDYRIKNKIPGFTMFAKTDKLWKTDKDGQQWLDERKLLIWHSDVPQDVYEYYERMKKDVSFRKMVGDWTVSFRSKILPPIKRRLKAKKSKLSFDDLRNRVRRDMDSNLAEEAKHDRSDIEALLDKFVDYACKELGIEEKPTVEYQKKEESAGNDHQPSFASYTPGTKTIRLAVSNRHPMDVMRSLGHELVHHKQNLDGRLGKDIEQEGSTGSEIENEANAGAGVLMRNYGKQNPKMFNLSPLIESFMLSEGLHDKGTFKVVFLAGGAGSGKDFILKRCIDGLGLVELNSDIAFTHIMKKAGLSLSMPDEESGIRDFMRLRAKNISDKKEDLVLDGRLGIIINGTAAEYNNTFQLKTKYESLGYKTMMVFVGTSNKTSRERNVARGNRGDRTVPEKVRYEKWAGSNKNKDRLQELFGHDHFIYVDNSVDISSANDETKRKVNVLHNMVYNKVKAFVDSPVNNERALSWIAQEKKRKRLSETNMRFDNIINEEGGAGLDGTPQLTHKYQKDTPGQPIGFRPMSILDMNAKKKEIMNRNKMKTEAKVEAKAEAKVATPTKRIPIGSDRLGQEIGLPKSPTFGDNQTIDFTQTPDPIARWMVKEETKRRFRQRYGALAEAKIREAASQAIKSESLDDPYSGAMGATPNSWNQETNNPTGGSQMDSEKQSLFGMKLKGKLNKKKCISRKGKQ
jgi:cytidylate kinase